MAGKIKKEKDIVRPQRWQDVVTCDRCGGRATHNAKSPSDYDKRELNLCKTHVEEHGEALKTQKFTVSELTPL